MNNSITKINKISGTNKVGASPLNGCNINQQNPKGEKHDRFSFISHGMAAKPLVSDRCRFYESIHLSAMDSVGKTEKNKRQKAQEQRQKQKQKQKAQAIGVSICCNQTIKAS
ncbi:MAG: hypothetical protein HDQ88_10660 [Clostridia bacterium]|nr:hypothetical protein [Clostridia bacterium]